MTNYEQILHLQIENKRLVKEILIHKSDHKLQSKILIEIMENTKQIKRIRETNKLTKRIYLKRNEQFIGF